MKLLLEKLSSLIYQQLFFYQPQDDHEKKNRDIVFTYRNNIESDLKDAGDDLNTSEFLLQRYNHYLASIQTCITSFSKTTDYFVFKKTSTEGLGNNLLSILKQAREYEATKKEELAEILANQAERAKREVTQSIEDAIKKKKEEHKKELEALIKSQEEETKKFQEDLIKEKAAAEKLKQEKEQMLTQHQKELNQKLNELETAKQSIEREKSALELQLATQKQEAENLKQQQEIVRRAHSEELLRQKQEFEASIAGEKRLLEQTKKEAEEQLQRVKLETEEQKKSLETALKEKAESESKLKLLEIAKKQIEIKLEASQKESEELSAQLLDKVRSNENFSSQIKEAERNNQLISQKLSSTEEEKRATEDKLQGIVAEKEALDKSIKQKELEIKDSTERLKKLEKEKEAIQKREKEAQQRCKQLEEEVNTLRTELTQRPTNDKLIKKPDPVKISNVDEENNILNMIFTTHRILFIGYLLKNSNEELQVLVGQLISQYEQPMNKIIASFLMNNKENNEIQHTVMRGVLESGSENEETHKIHYEHYLQRLAKTVEKLNCKDPVYHTNYKLAKLALESRKGEKKEQDKTPLLYKLKNRATLFKELKSKADQAYKNISTPTSTLQ